MKPEVKQLRLPQILYESGITTKKIVVTQARRVSAISVAKQVAQEMG